MCVDTDVDGTVKEAEEDGHAVAGTRTSRGDVLKREYGEEEKEVDSGNDDRDDDDEEGDDADVDARVWLWLCWRGKQKSSERNGSSRMEEAAVVAAVVSSVAGESAKLPIITMAEEGVDGKRKSGVFKKCACVCVGVLVSVCVRICVRGGGGGEVMRRKREERERREREKVCVQGWRTRKKKKKKVGKETGTEGQLSGHVMARGQGR